MIARQSKALLVLMIGLFSLLVGVDNIIDYGTNYAFVEHVMEMDTVFPNSTLKWRAIASDTVNTTAYALIIAVEIATGLLCIVGALRLWHARGESAGASAGAWPWPPPPCGGSSRREPRGHRLRGGDRR